MRNKVSLGSMLQQSEGAIQAQIDDEIILMSINQGQYFGLDPIASAIWRLLEEPIATSEIIDKLSSTYDVERSECEKDTLEFLNAIALEGLIVECSGNS